MATAKKRRCKHGRSKTTGKCKKAPAKSRRKRGGSSEWTAERVAREEAAADRADPNWRHYGEPQSFYNPWGGLGRMKSRRRRSRR